VESDVTASGRFAPDRLHEFCRRVFESFGISSLDADQAAHILLVADCRGIDSHGVARLKAYVDLLEEGRINPRPTIRVVRDSPAAATVDGDNGLKRPSAPVPAGLLFVTPTISELRAIMPWRRSAAI
jgi:LDH2 family malate/lactate/ureidoglycolate dehydrogenase